MARYDCINLPIFKKNMFSYIAWYMAFLRMICASRFYDKKWLISSCEWTKKFKACSRNHSLSFVVCHYLYQWGFLLLRYVYSRSNVCSMKAIIRWKAVVMVILMPNVPITWTRPSNLRNHIIENFLNSYWAPVRYKF